MEGKKIVPRFLILKFLHHISGNTNSSTNQAIVLQFAHSTIRDSRACGGFQQIVLLLFFAVTSPGIKQKEKKISKKLLPQGFENINFFVPIITKKSVSCCVYKLMYSQLIQFFGLWSHTPLLSCKQLYLFKQGSFFSVIFFYL